MSEYVFQDEPEVARRVLIRWAIHAIAREVTLAGKLSMPGRDELPSWAMATWPTPPRWQIRN